MHDCWLIVCIQVALKKAKTIEVEAILVRKGFSMIRSSHCSPFSPFLQSHSPFVPVSPASFGEITSQLPRNSVNNPTGSKAENEGSAHCRGCWSSELIKVTIHHLLWHAKSVNSPTAIVAKKRNHVNKFNLFVPVKDECKTLIEHKSKILV